MKLPRLVTLTISCLPAVLLLLSGALAPVPPPEPAVTLSYAVEEPAPGVSVFSMTAADFAAGYNSLYRQCHHADYLPALWSGYQDVTPCLGTPVTRFWFSEDETIPSMPTISLHVPPEGGICEIEVTYDHHSHQDDLFDIFQQLCFYTLKTALPQWSDADITTVCQELYRETESNFWGGVYEDGHPPLTVLYLQDTVGFYGYYGAGTANICLLPVTGSTLLRLQQQGTVFQPLTALLSP